ncbi:MAG TPA: hypothetical protein VH540_09990 [Ktedonobacterales bacterium]|jgi:hypothetical protein
MARQEYGALLKHPNYDLLDDFLLGEHSIAMLIEKYGYSRDAIYKFLEVGLGKGYLSRRIKENYRVQSQDRPTWDKGLVGSASHSYGRVFTEETRKKHSAAFTGKAGHKQSAEMREQISKTLSQFIRNRPIYHRQRWQQGYFISAKNRTVFFYRSAMELQVATLLERLEKVSSYQVEPFCVPWYTTRGAKRYYTPDIQRKGPGFSTPSGE